MLLAATADRAAALELRWEGQAQGRLDRYLRRRGALTGNSWDTAYLPQLQPLGKVLLMLLTASKIANNRTSMRLVNAALQELVEQRGLGRAAISRQLQRAQQGSMHQLLTVDQLDAALVSLCARRGTQIMTKHELGPPDAAPALYRNLAATTLAFCGRLVTLQPHSVGALLTAASAGTAVESISIFGTEHARQFVRHVAGLHMAAFRAAQDMHSQYWAVTAGSRALACILAHAIVGCADLAELVAAVERAPAAVQQLRRVLPQSWVSFLEGYADMATGLLPLARLRMQGHSGMAAEQQAALRTLQEQQTTQPRGSMCSGCGKEALGLRRCARCKKASCEWAGRGLCWQDGAWEEQHFMFLRTSQDLQPCAHRPPPVFPISLQTAPASARCA